jgi:hypothetical protein
VGRAGRGRRPRHPAPGDLASSGWTGEAPAPRGKPSAEPRLGPGDLAPAPRPQGAHRQGRHEQRGPRARQHRNLMRLRKTFGPHARRTLTLDTASRRRPDTSDRRRQARAPRRCRAARPGPWAMAAPGRRGAGGAGGVGCRRFSEGGPRRYQRRSTWLQKANNAPQFIGTPVVLQCPKSPSSHASTTKIRSCRRRRQMQGRRLGERPARAGRHAATRVAG